MNNPVFPFNTTSPLANPHQPVATWNCTGLKNVLFNASTTTGIWRYGMVIGTKLMLDVYPESSNDNTMVAVSACQDVASLGGPYPSAEAIAQSPSSAVMIADANSKNHLVKYWSSAQLAGLNNELWATQFNNYSFTAALGPVVIQLLQVSFDKLDNGTFTSNVGIRAQLQFRVRLFGRVDSALLEA